MLNLTERPPLEPLASYWVELEGDDYFQACRVSASACANGKKSYFLDILIPETRVYYEDILDANLVPTRVASDKIVLANHGLFEVEREAASFSADQHDDLNACLLAFFAHFQQDDPASVGARKCVIFELKKSMILPATVPDVCSDLSIELFQSVNNPVLFKCTVFEKVNLLVRTVVDGHEGFVGKVVDCDWTMYINRDSNYDEFEAPSVEDALQSVLGAVKRHIDWAGGG